MKTRLVSFEYWVMDGSSYQVGQFEGNVIRKHPSSMRFFQKNQHEMDSKTKNTVRDILVLYKQFSPGLIEEIQGCADSLSISPERLIYYTLSFPRAGQCSQIAVNTDVTKNGHVLVARNYDMYPQDNPTLLCTTRVKGKHAHIGFSYMIFDRVDGLNDQGLSVTMTQSGPGVLDDYYMDVFYRRTILDICKDVDDALDFLRDIPNFCSSSMILADKKGNIALIELGLNGRRSIKAINRNSFEKYVFTTNHYTLPSMTSYFPHTDPNSLARFKIIKDRLDEWKPEISNGDLMLLLSTKMPYGVFNGTLWSIVFDLNDTKALIRFGVPVLNQVKKYSLTDPAGITEFQVKCAE